MTTSLLDSLIQDLQCREAPPFERIVAYSDDAALARAWQRDQATPTTRAAILTRVRDGRGVLWVAAGLLSVAVGRVRGKGSKPYVQSAAHAVVAAARGENVRLLQLARIPDEAVPAYDVPWAPAVWLASDVVHLAMRVRADGHPGDYGSVLQHAHTLGLFKETDAWLAAHAPPPTSVEVMTTLKLRDTP